jgi:hypothetical protein
MNNTPKPGEIVYLNSGSPDLKVVGYCEVCRLVEVEWQANGTAMSHHFPLACLRQA